MNLGKYLIASSSETDLEILKMLSYDPDFLVRMAVASNDSSDFSILTKLCNDENEDVRKTAEMMYNEKMVVS